MLAARRTKRLNITQTYYQMGMLTLITCLLLLTLSTLITMQLSNTALVAQKITNNEIRAVQAISAAETGLVTAKSYLSKDPDVDSNAKVDLIFDTNGDELGDSNSSENITVVVAASTSDLDYFDIESSGFSNDQTTARTITQSVSFLPPLRLAPSAPLTVRGHTMLSGRVNLSNAEGFSSMWAGGLVDLGDQEYTNTHIVDATSPLYPACLTPPSSCPTALSSDRHTQSVDIIEADSKLALVPPQDLFQQYFGMNHISFQRSIATINEPVSNFAKHAHLAAYEVIYSDGNTTLNGITIGCRVALMGSSPCPSEHLKPAIVVINGDARLSGNLQLYGVLFVTGNLHAEGSAAIVGAVIVSGNAYSQNGSLTITYNSQVLRSTKRAGPLTAVPGTWKDF